MILCCRTQSWTIFWENKNAKISDSFEHIQLIQLLILRVRLPCIEWIHLNTWFYYWMFFPSFILYIGIFDWYCAFHRNDHIQNSFPIQTIQLILNDLHTNNFYSFKFKKCCQFLGIHLNLFSHWDGKRRKITNF